MATTSLGSSTTQIAVPSRRGSAQIRHCSASATLPQVSQNRTLALTSVSASTSRLTSIASAWSRWKAMRCALLGPTPGQPAELVDQVLDHAFVHTGEPMPSAVSRRLDGAPPQPLTQTRRPGPSR